MKRTINWTGRKRIPRDRITIRLHELVGGQTVPSFTFQLGDLRDLSLPDEARIYIEPNVGSSWMRFDAGTVRDFSPPKNPALTEIDFGGQVRFRIKVVDESDGTGRLLAATEVSPDADTTDGRKPLLPLLRTDLGEQLWQLHIGRDDGPQLRVNNRIPSLADDLVRNPLFQGAVIPHVLRRVFTALFEAEDDVLWVEDWRTFASNLNGEEIDWDADTDQYDSVEETVERLVKVFCERHKYVTRALQPGEHRIDG